MLARCVELNGTHCRYRGELLRDAGRGDAGVLARLGSCGSWRAPTPQARSSPATRDRELPVRAALGASRSWLVRQVLADTGVLGIIGAAVDQLLGSPRVA